MNIGGYSLLGEFRTTGGGRCKWAFAERGGKEYFLKCFLSPKQVVPGRSAGSPATLAAQKARCDAFEFRQNKLLQALSGKSGVGGNLIAPIEFFSFDGCYYKVTEKVTGHLGGVEFVNSLPIDSAAIVLRSAANSIRILHSSGIVHGDIKTDNIIVRTRDSGIATASIIDFDDSYFSTRPPLPPEEFTFDPPYAAPEVFRFISEPNPRSAAALTVAADVFSLGIVFCEYISGQKPVGVGRRYAGEALVLGGAVVIPDFPSGWSDDRVLVQQMLSLDPTNRPTLKDVLDRLQRPPSKGAAHSSETRASTTPSVGKLKSSIRAVPSKTSPDRPVGAETAPPSLRGSLTLRTGPGAAPTSGPKLRGTLAPKRES